MRERFLCGRVWDVVSNATERDGPEDLAVFIEGELDILSYPLDLVLLQRHAASFLASEYPVRWQIRPARRAHLCWHRRTADLLGSTAQTAVIAGDGAGGVLASCDGSSHRFGRLRHVSEEIAAVERTVPKGFKVVAVRGADKRALREAVQELQAHRADRWIDLLHFSGHSYLETRRGHCPDKSGLVLSNRDAADSVSLLTFGEILGLFKDRDADRYYGVGLAFVNSCHGATIVDDETGKHGFCPSLIHAFESLPIRHIVCHRWRVSDCLARHFARSFYEDYFERKAGVAMACLRARRAIGYDRPHADLHRQCGDMCRRGKAQDEPAGSLDDLTWLAPVLVVRSLDDARNPG